MCVLSVWFIVVCMLYGACELFNVYLVFVSRVCVVVFCDVCVHVCMCGVSQVYVMCLWCVLVCLCCVCILFVVYGWCTCCVDVVCICTV